MEVKEICTKQDDTNSKEEIDSQTESTNVADHTNNNQPSTTSTTEPPAQGDSHLPERKPISRFFVKKGKGNTAIEAVLHNKITKLQENKVTASEASPSTESDPKGNSSLRVKKGSSRERLGVEIFRERSYSLGAMLERRATREELIIRNILRGDNEVVMSWGPFSIQRITKELRQNVFFEFEKEIKHPKLFKEVENFKIESGYEYSNIVQVVIENAEKDCHYYKEHFASKDHLNYVGTQKDGSPVIVSIRKDIDKTIPSKDKEHPFRAVVRTPTATQFGYLYSTSSSKAIRGMKIVKPSKFGDTNWKLVSNDISNDLVQMEEQLICLNYKFGILYRKEGQSTEDEMFSNNMEDTSSEFSQFLSFIGEKIELKGWKYFRGGLDVKSGSTGTHSLYTKFYDYEVMFHVAPWLPFSQRDKQQLERKRHLGNDVVVIIFQQDPNQQFDPNTLTSEFNRIYSPILPDFTDVFVLIAPVKKSNKTLFRISIASKSGVPTFGPDFPCNALFYPGEALRDFLLTKRNT